MPDKSNFTPDEWKLLLESVMMGMLALAVMVGLLVGRRLADYHAVRRTL